MSDVREQLKNVRERMDALEKQPSNLAKDAVLADLRALYDAVSAVDVTRAEQQEETVAETAEPVIYEPIAEKEPAPVRAEEAVTGLREEQGTIAEEKPAADETHETNTDMNILAGKLNRTPLRDLGSGIPLNERFSIIRNLFDGNESDFREAVLKLNNSGSADEMGRYLYLLKQRLGWNTEDESYISFAGYVERRMIAAEPSNADADQ